MGAFGAGFLSTLGDAAQKHVDEVHDEEKAQKDQKAKFYWDAIGQSAKNGTLTEDQLNYGVDQASKVYGLKPIKESFGRAKEAISKAMGHPEWTGGTHGKDDQQGGGSGAAPPSTENKPTPTDSKSLAQGGVIPPPPAAPKPEIQPLPPPSFPAVLPPMPGTMPITGKRMADAQGRSGTDNPYDGQPAPDALPPMPTSTMGGVPPAVDDAFRQLNEPINAVDSQQAFINAAYPSQQSQDDRAFGQWKRQQDVLHEAKMQEVQAAAAAKDQTGRNVFGPTTSVRNARVLAGQGHSYPDADGNDIDLTQLPDDMGMKYVARGSKHWYEPFSPNQKEITIGNETYAINPADLSALTQGAGTDLGVHNVGNTRMTPKPVIINGQPVFVPTTSSTTPNTPGVNRTGVQPQKSPIPGHSGVTTPPAPIVPPTTVQVSPNAKPKSKGGILAPPPASGSKPTSTAGNGMPKGTMTLPPGTSFPGQFTAQQKRYTAINDAGIALDKFARPQEDGISNLDIFKDPQAVQRVGKYLSMNNQQIEGDFKSAESGGLEGVASFYAGIPTAYAENSTKAVKDAYDQLTPHDKRFVSDYYFLLGNWGGMRAASGASGSKWNFNNLSQEIPNPMSITSYDEARRKVEDNFSEFDQISKPNQTVIKLDKNSILPPKKGGLKPPPGGGKSNTPETKREVSIAAAMALPENKGKTAEAVKKHIESLNYTAVP